MTITDETDSRQGRIARFRLMVIGSLLSCPPKKGALKAELSLLAKKAWNDPITKRPVYFSVSTIERWFYRARNEADPMVILRPKRRIDADAGRVMSEGLAKVLAQQYREHPTWSCQLHVDNLAVLVKGDISLGKMPCYATIRRYMKKNNLPKRKWMRSCSPGAIQAASRLEECEVRSYEIEYVHGLWHLDFHHGSRKVVGEDGQWHKPLLLAIMDDHSRLVCHAQWYLDEKTDSLVHGFKQACQKRGLPRAVMSDNGSAMTSDEFTQGIARLSIVHQPTLPYSPYQNGKQEVFWGQVEGRLLPMIEGLEEVGLKELNDITLAWIEMEYHRAIHSETGKTPVDRLTYGKTVGRPCPDRALLKEAFMMQVKRKQRKSDGTISLDGCRFEIPNAYRHMPDIVVRYARWDLSVALLIDPHNDTCLTRLSPQDKSANADGMRRLLSSPGILPLPSAPMAPLLKQLMAEYAATGLPPAYLPKEGRRT